MDFKSYLPVFRPTPSVFKNFWCLTTETENSFLLGLA
jgi:hypothetical protein